MSELSETYQLRAGVALLDGTVVLDVGRVPAGVQVSVTASDARTRVAVTLPREKVLWALRSARVLPEDVDATVGLALDLEAARAERDGLLQQLRERDGVLPEDKGADEDKETVRRLLNAEGIPGGHPLAPRVASLLAKLHGTEAALKEMRERDGVTDAERAELARLRADVRGVQGQLDAEREKNGTLLTERAWLNREALRLHAESDDWRQRAELAQAEALRTRDALAKLQQQLTEQQKAWESEAARVAELERLHREEGNRLQAEVDEAREARDMERLRAEAVEREMADVQRLHREADEARRRAQAEAQQAREEAAQLRQQIAERPPALRPLSEDERHKVVLAMLHAHGASTAVPYGRMTAALDAALPLLCPEPRALTPEEVSLSWECGFCDGRFLTKKERDTHRRTCTVNLPDSCDTPESA